MTQGTDRRTINAMDETTFDAIMADIADGLPMRQAADNASVSRRACWYAINSTDERMHKYARAKESMVEALADDMLQIADTCRRGVKTTTKADGSVETVDGDMVDRARLQVDSRKWLLSKLAPKRYGDKLELAGNDSAPFVIQITETQSKL